MEPLVQVRVAGLAVQENKLLVLRYDYPNGRIHALPGGRLESGEFAPQALAREFEEELALHIDVKELLFVGEMATKGKIPQTLHLIFRVEVGAQQPVINPKETSAFDFEWLPIGELEGKHLYPDIAAQIINQNKGLPTATFLGNVLNRPWL